MDEKKPNSTKELQAAIRILEKFSREKEISQSFSLFRKTMSFARQMLSDASPMGQGDIHHAIEVIKKNASLIQSLAEGTPNQRLLATSAYAAVDRFNIVSEQLKKRSLSWRRWMDNIHIEIPKPTSLSNEIPRRYSLEAEKNRLTSFVETNVFVNHELLPSKQELDAFRMKIITLLKHHEVRFTSLTEQLHMIREIPIVLIEDADASKCIVALHQTLSLFPGETIELKGAFKRLPRSNYQSVPIADSFHMSTQSRQTGFPHPSQHNGWALSHELLPSEHPLIEKMEEIACELMPNARLNDKAKELLKMKQYCFGVHAHEFLDLHKQLNRAILRIAKIEKNQILDHFFDRLKMQNNAYILLSRIQEQIVTCYIEKKEQMHKPIALDAYDLDLEYMLLMGAAYQKILNNNKNLLEASALKQLEEFIFELGKLNVKSTEDMHRWIQGMLLSDIERFS